jgi:hypothetical protein
MAQTSKQVALKYGFRSGLEESIAAKLSARGVPYKFEERVIEYTRPQKKSKYTPDFELPNGIIIESKGRFITADRQKHLLVKAQHPELDIRFVFSNSRSRITKSSATTYAMWAEKNGFLYSDKDIPDSWIKEKKAST